MDLHSLYEKLPLTLQHLAVSTKGLAIRRARYSGAYHQYARRALTSQWKSKLQWRRIQAKKLHRIVEYARNHVPHYRRTLQHVDLSPLRSDDAPDIASVLEQIPLTEKEPIRQHPERYRSNELPSMKTVAFRTSGTTGTPLRILQSLASHRILNGVKARFWRSAGVRYGDRRLSFTGNYVVPLETNGPPFGRMDHANNRRMMSVYHLSPSNMPSYLDEIRRFDPDFIDGYPSAMEFCARAALERGVTLETAAAFPTAETLTEQQRQVIEEGFGTRVYNHYGSMEGAALITECPAGNMHINPEIGIVELLDSVDQLESSEMVVTSLNNRAMPFIRYRIGDMAVPHDNDEPCPCGRQMPIVGNIVGRRDDMVVTPDGRHVMLGYNLLKYATGVQEAQIVQYDISTFELRVVPDSHFGSDDEQFLVDRLRRRIGREPTINVRVVDQIERTDRGKLRSVISYADSPDCEHDESS